MAGSMLLLLLLMPVLAMVSCHVDRLTQFVTECPPDDVSRPRLYHDVCVSVI